jgi:hypothetical protein
MFSNSGQALVEYILVLLFITSLSVAMTGRLTNFFRDSTGNLAHVLSGNLMVGICKSECFFGGYKNGYTGTQ